MSEYDKCSEKKKIEQNNGNWECWRFLKFHKHYAVTFLGSCYFTQLGKSKAYLGLRGKIQVLSRALCLISEQIVPRKIRIIVLCPRSC